MKPPARLCALAAAGVSWAAVPAGADILQYGGLTYETVDWQLASPVTDTAAGVVGDVGVLFSAPYIHTSDIGSHHYPTDSAFDGGTWNSGVAEHIENRGARPGQASVQFTQDVYSVLIIVGAPNDDTFENQYGASRWDFADELTIDCIDCEPGLGVLPGNITWNSEHDGAGHMSGVFRVEAQGLAPFQTLEWMQWENGAGNDRMDMTFAIALVPAPGALGLLALGGLVAARRRRA